MVKSESHIPKLRFKGFSDEWTFTKFKNMYPTVRNGFVGVATPYYVDNGVIYVQGRNIKSGKLLNNGYVNISHEFHTSKPNTMLKVNDLLMVQSGHVGECAVVTPQYANSNCHAILVATPKSNDLCNSNLYVNYFLSDVGRKKIHMITTGNTIQHILSSDLKEVSVPKIAIQEQNQIGNFFQKIDQVIELQQKALDTARDYKKSMLQKMFPQKGEKVPQIRFDGFSGDWEEKKLGEHTEYITKGTTPKIQLEHGNINFIKVENINNGKIFPVVKISEDEHFGYLKRSQLKENDILFSIAGTLGRIAVVTKNILPANTNQALAIIREYAFDRLFLIAVLIGRVVADYVRQNPTIGAQPNLSLEQIKSLSFMCPQVEEQQKIGEFFQKLDQQIEQHEKKLQSYQNLKKAMLQRLFV
ncbi:restriction endonuclease subunit S [Wohlfahrtiimonas chitiniclastica]|uniref:restriction endonuclease subunit S n=1 Tax=Wohlfahrtiimonas chitiniclastica TaxID=400946 RepID=UPI000B992143|nr:restriction endonuclease subunit S [Wohlfahrtiimonas chitiniclastica]OYQ76114.1 hypothetical protein B9T18_01785 [Wohlfahrtiimonas chitiniclastica]